MPNEYPPNNLPPNNLPPNVTDVYQVPNNGIPMPGSAMTRYLPGSVRTDVSGGPGGGGGNSLSALIEDLIRRRVAGPPPRQSSLESHKVNLGAGPAAYSTPAESEGPSGDARKMGRLRERMMEAQVGEAEQKTASTRRTIPTRMVTVGNQSFATPDQFQMTGADRSIFLPNNAQQMGAFHEIPFGEGPQVGDGPVGEGGQAGGEELQARIARAQAIKKMYEDKLAGLA